MLFSWLLHLSSPSGTVFFQLRCCQGVGGDFSTPGSPAKAPQWAPCWLRAQVSPGRGSDGLGYQAGAFRTHSVRSLPCRRQHLLWEVGSGP